MIKKLKDKLFKKKAEKDPTYLGTEKIGKLLRIQSYPAVIGQVVIALYNFIDTIFVGKVVGNDGIAAVSIVMPAYLIITSFGLALGIGASSIISRALGAKDHTKINTTFGAAQLCVLLSTALIIVLCFLFKDSLLRLFGATPEIWELSSSYFSIVIFGQIFAGFVFANTALIRAIGDTKTVMVIQITGIILNIILDYLFMFVREWGIAGAARATVASWAFSSFYAIGYYLRGQKIIQISFRYFVLRRETLKDIFLLGIPTFFRQVIGSFTMILVNNLLRSAGGTDAISAFGMVNRVLMLFMMPLFGMTQGLAPIIGYNYGAKKYRRVYDVLRLTFKLLTGFGVVISLIYLVYPHFLLDLFTSSETKDEAVLQISQDAVRLIMATFWTVGFQVVMGTYYQSVGLYQKSFVLSLLRQLFVFLPLLFVCSRLWELTGIWVSFPITDVIAAAITIRIFRKDWKKLKKLARNKEANVEFGEVAG
jgi:putative MATE family efflux protein